MTIIKRRKTETTVTRRESLADTARRQANELLSRRLHTCHRCLSIPHLNCNCNPIEESMVDYDGVVIHRCQVQVEELHLFHEPNGFTAP